MSVFMRRAKVDDLDAIMRLERATFVNDAWPEDAMRRELENPHAYYLVAVDEDAEDPDRRLLGYAGLALAGRWVMPSLAELKQTNRVGR